MVLVGNLVSKGIGMSINAQNGYSYGCTRVPPLPIPGQHTRTHTHNTLTQQGKAESPGPKEFAPAFRAAVDAIQKYGGARAGSRTMLDALLPACEALEEVVAKGE
eukprot:scaffold314050_cov19-Tisochrysis_lutea.AAC.2